MIPICAQLRWDISRLSIVEAQEERDLAVAAAVEVRPGWLAFKISRLNG